MTTIRIGAGGVHRTGIGAVALVDVDAGQSVALIPGIACTSEATDSVRARGVSTAVMGSIGALIHILASARFPGVSRLADARGRLTVGLVGPGARSLIV